MSKIFLSYRRDDTAFVCSSIYNNLAERYGANNVYKDIDNIPYGVDFREHIMNSIENCDVVLVLIGSQWLTISDENNNLKIFNQNDLVRLEVETAITNNIKLIPLIINTKMPIADDLPSSIKSLSYRNGIAIRPSPDYERDLLKLHSILDEIVELPSPGHASSMQPNKNIEEDVVSPKRSKFSTALNYFFKMFSTIPYLLSMIFGVVGTLPAMIGGVLLAMIVLTPSDPTGEILNNVILFKPLFLGFAFGSGALGGLLRYSIATRFPDYYEKKLPLKPIIYWLCVIYAVIFVAIILGQVSNHEKQKAIENLFYSSSIVLVFSTVITYLIFGRR